MKPETLHSLLTGRVLLDEAKRLIDAEDRHLSTAGLLALQDSLELILLALLRERAVDERKNIESKSFDDLLGELRSDGVRIPKIGTLKAMNKERVVCKHYGQLAEPITVRNFLHCVNLAIDAMVNQVIGRGLEEVFVTDLLDDGDAKEFLANAAELAQNKKFLRALIEIRKAIYVEIEHDYSIYGYRSGANDDMGSGLIGFAMKGGLKAPYYTRNQNWIEQHVNNPIEYVQIDYDRLRLDAMEWGVHTEELHNVRRLTPEVFRADPDSEWKVQYNLEYPHNQANQVNFTYCLDRTVAIILRKQLHKRPRRLLDLTRDFDPPPVYIGMEVYKQASRDSEVLHTVNPTRYEYRTYSMVSGFSDGERFYVISGTSKQDNEFLPYEMFRGYLLVREE